MGDAQGTLNEKIAAGSTEFKEAKADVADMQVAVGKALKPIKDLAIQGFMLLADILIALEPAIEAVGEVLAGITAILSPLIDALGKLIDWLFKTKDALRNLRDESERTRDAWWRLDNQIAKVIGREIPSWMKPSIIPFSRFHSGGTVPGPTGTEQVVKVQAGETITPAASAASPLHQPSAGVTINVTVNAGLANPTDTAREIVDLLVEYTQLNGPVNIKTKG